MKTVITILPTLSLQRYQEIMKYLEFPAIIYIFAK